MVLAFALVTSLATGCRSEFFPSESGAAPELVADLRGTGRVLATTTTERYWDGHTEITDILVLDVGGSSFRDGLDKALGILRARGWEAEDPPHLWRTRLESDKWDGAWIAVEPLMNYEVATSEGFDEQLDTSNATLFKRLIKRNTSGHLVVVEAHPDPDN
ncbi:hypothetical protein E1292_49215 [Nonomuraea deserti]|uniref:Uncharacterized protein n=1 Tax=Nonomuraea deserti TaxID=1848322 RepID=A0A4R4U1W7_9ACTN|nr:hypothetical protein [Nonomuraea deserti]TDC84760.1 hypothetical protein E1292_49215 [Nonomuraea deserti]